MYGSRMRNVIIFIRCTYCGTTGKSTCVYRCTYISECGARVEGLRTIDYVVAPQRDNNPLSTYHPSHPCTLLLHPMHCTYILPSSHKLIPTPPRTHPGTNSSHHLGTTSPPPKPLSRRIYVHWRKYLLRQSRRKDTFPIGVLHRRSEAYQVPLAPLRPFCGLLSRADRAGTCSAQWTGGAEP